MLTEDYCDFETAKLLKEKGFKGIGAHFYDTAGNFLHFDAWMRALPEEKYEFIEAPTLQMAMKWLREAHKIDIDIVSRLSLNADDDHCYSHIIKHQYDKYHYKTYTDGEYLKFEEACEEAIKCCLEDLI